MPPNPQAPNVRRNSQEPPIGDLIPRTGLFPLYVSRATTLTDAPPVYHVGALLGALSAVVAPHARILVQDKGRLARRPVHVWIVLCGDPDNRKSYSVDLATEIMAPWLSDRSYRPSGSKQGIEEVLWSQPFTFFPIREAPTFLADNRAVWMRGGSSFWCEVFDGKMRRRLLRAGEEKPEVDSDGNEVPINRTEEKQVCVTMLLAGATEGLVENTKRTDWTAGFMSRMMFLSAGRGKQWEDGFDWGEEDIARLRNAVSRVVGMVERHGDIERSAEAREVYSAWFSEISGGLDGLSLGLRSILSRLRRHVAVAAALFAVSCGTTTITADHMRAAVALGRYSHRSVLGLPVKIR